ncbi:Hypothetical protein CINCED_3A013803 [Cinara cedri]|uniref:Uncharacterized protein n=1 Tax=Cinara cedri TaxID=506608 RepID=A0A5E4NP98_9HEMI|nr:Hypothetical protein CINCED_3A013803 [Cinara cedri]
MKCLINVYIFLVLCYNHVLCFETANQAANDIREFIRIIKREKEQILSKRINFVDDEVMSIDDYLSTISKTNSRKNKGSKGAEYMDNTELITEQNVFEVSSLLNSIISCEYCDFLFNIIDIVNLSLNNYKQIKNDVLSKNNANKKKNIANLMRNENKTALAQYVNYRTPILTSVIKMLEKIAFVLVKLLKYTKNFVSKKHGILKILLSLYLYLNRDINLPLYLSDIDARIDTSKKIIFQVYQQLIEYKIKNCILHLNYITGKTLTIQRVPTIDLIQLNNEVNKISNFQTSDDPKFFILSNNKPEDKTSSINKIIQMINCTNHDKKAEIKWEGRLKDIKTIYTVDIKTSFDIKTVLRFEKLILKKIIDIIYSFIFDILNSIFKYSNGELSLIYKLIYKIENYITKFKNEGQSFYLVDSIIFIKHKLWILSLHRAIISNSGYDYLQDFSQPIQQYFKNDKFKLKDELGDYSSLDRCFEHIKDTVIYTELHPVISNVYWEKPFFSLLEISNLVMDYKTLYFPQTFRKFNDEDDVCLVLEKTLVEISDDTIFDCYNHSINPKTPKELMEHCFKRFHEMLESVILDLSDLIDDYSDYIKPTQTDANRLLLFLIYNKYNVELFNLKVMISMNTKRIEHLIIFKSIVYNLLVSFSHKSNCSIIDIEPKYTLSFYQNNWSETDVWFDTKENWQAYSERINLKNIYKYQDYLKGIMNIFTNAITQVSKKTLFVRYKLYWDGIPKTFEEIQTNYTNYIFDLEDIEDYQLFLIKWLITPVYIILFHIVIEIMNSKKGLDKDCVETFFVLTVKLSDFTELSIIDLFPTIHFVDLIALFIRTVDVFRGNEYTRISNLKIFLLDEICRLGVLFNLDANSDAYDEFDSNRINEFCLNLSISESILQLTTYIEYLLINLQYDRKFVNLIYSINKKKKNADILS